MNHSRNPIEIRDEIETLACQRLDVSRILGHRPETATVLAPQRIELEKRIGGLWEELRVALSPRGIRQKVVA